MRYEAKRRAGLKVLSLLLITVIAIALFPAQTNAIDWDVEKSKTAAPTVLNAANKETTVTLSLPAADTVEPGKARIVILLDKSSVGDIGAADFKEATTSLIDELLETVNNDNADIMVDVISFNWTVKDKTNGFVQLNDANKQAIYDAITTDLNGTGTNIYGAINYANWRLTNTADAALTGVTADQKYLILVSDMGGYLFSDSIPAGTTDAATALAAVNTNTVYRALLNNNSGEWDARKTMTRPDSSLAYGPIISRNITVTTQQIDDLISNKIVLSGVPAADKWLNPANATVKAANQAEMETADYANSYEANIYFNGNTLLAMKQSGINIIAATRAYKPTLNNGVLLDAFSAWMEDNLGKRYDLSGGDTVSDAFSGIVAQIVYAIGKGTITDEIGDDFSMVIPATGAPFTLTVSGTALPAVATGTGNEWGFGTKLDHDDDPVTPDVYPYVVQYVPGADEKFIWTLNVPVVKAKRVQLSYKLELLDSIAASGSYNTNRSATLAYTSSDGKITGSESFEVPSVTYTAPVLLPADIPFDLLVDDGGGLDYINGPREATVGSVVRFAGNIDMSDIAAIAASFGASTGYIAGDFEIALTGSAGIAPTAGSLVSADIADYFEGDAMQFFELKSAPGYDAATNKITFKVKVKDVYGTTGITGAECAALLNQGLMAKSAYTATVNDGIVAPGYARVVATFSGKIVFRNGSGTRSFAINMTGVQADPDNLADPTLDTLGVDPDTAVSVTITYKASPEPNPDPAPAPPSAPKTGDGNGIYLNIALMLFALVGITALVLYSRKKRANKQSGEHRD